MHTQNNLNEQQHKAYPWIKSKKIIIDKLVSDIQW